MQRQDFVTNKHTQKTIVIVHVPMPSGNDYYSDSTLSYYELENWKTMKVFGYWYGNGGYEGTGYAIYQCGDGKWNQKHLGHCSCNGPLEGISDDDAGIYKTLDELVATFTNELKNDTKAIVEALKAQGY